jgi:bacteriorhodopsin
MVWLFSSPLLITILIYLGRTRLTTATALLGSSVLGVVTAFLATIAADSS